MGWGCSKVNNRIYFVKGRWRNFKKPFIYRGTRAIHNGTIQTFLWATVRKISSFFYVKVWNSDNLNHCLNTAKNHKLPIDTNAFFQIENRISHSSWSDKGWKGTVVKCTCTCTCTGTGTCTSYLNSENFHLKLKFGSPFCRKPKLKTNMFKIQNEGYFFDYEYRGDSDMPPNNWRVSLKLRPFS